MALTSGTGLADEPPPVRLGGAGPTPRRAGDAGWPEIPQDYTTQRYEPAGFPLLGGDSDIGFQFGAVATLTRFDGGVAPYLWNMDFVLAASVRAGPLEKILQQSYLWSWERAPALSQRPGTPQSARRLRTDDQRRILRSRQREQRRATAALRWCARALLSIHLRGGARSRTRPHRDSRAVGPHGRSQLPDRRARLVYPEKQARRRSSSDANGPPLVKKARASPGSPAPPRQGVVFDTRDNEIFPPPRAVSSTGVAPPRTRAFRWAPASTTSKRAPSSPGSIPLGQDVVFALRGVLDFKFGHVPFYDLFTAGPFITAEMPGGAEGVRGVPIGRYLGPIKGVANAEIRTLATAVHVLGGSFRLGASAFVDTGRVWSDYSFASPLDGSGLGLKYGAGVGGISAVGAGRDLSHRRRLLLPMRSPRITISTRDLRRGLINVLKQSPAPCDVFELSVSRPRTGRDSCVPPSGAEF